MTGHKGKRNSEAHMCNGGKPEQASCALRFFFFHLLVLPIHPSPYLIARPLHASISMRLVRLRFQGSIGPLVLFHVLYRLEKGAL